MAELVHALVKTDEARICGVVAVELLQGVKGDRELSEMNWLLEDIQRLETMENDWDEAGRHLMGLRRRGITIPITDALIAVVARRNGVPVLTADEHFRHLDVDLYTLDAPDA